uniref:Large ribosomal subunit protein uL30m n=1 Tax=Coturnix japonica TaxID=93934 RepID=A0A8C2SK34_COTJA
MWAVLHRCPSSRGTHEPQWRCPAGRLHTDMVLGRRPEGIVPTQWARQKFTKSRVPEWVFQPRPGDHEKYGGDPEQPHKVHIVTRIKSVIGRPYWEKKIIHDLGLDKVWNILHILMFAFNHLLCYGEKEYIKGS